jgi:glycosyltransferase involved in cell wall biosynthesis
MGNLPLVSINITTYNRAHLLPRCIDSVLRQTYANLEIIIANDCSTDNTKSVVRHYIKKDKRIKYIDHDKNLGNAHTRNTALKNCKGKYIAFLDDDDEWIDPDKLKKEVGIFEKYPHSGLGIVCSNVQFIKKESRRIEQLILPADMKKAILKGNSIIHNSTVLTTRRILLEVGGFDTKLKRGIDSDFYRTCILRFGYRVFLLPDITTNYYEEGPDRITLLNSRKSIIKHIHSNFYCIRKYFRYFLKYPSVFLYRILRITKASFLLLRAYI